MKLSEIGVLYKEHKMAAELQQCLNQKEIPISVSKKVNILEESLTNMLLNIFTYINDESKIAHSREDLLFEILHYPFFDVLPIQTARLSLNLEKLAIKAQKQHGEKPCKTWRLFGMKKVIKP